MNIKKREFFTSGHVLWHLSFSFFFFLKSKPHRVHIGNSLKSINSFFFFDANKNDLIVILMASHTFHTGFVCRAWEALGLVWPTSALTGNQTRAFISPVFLNRSCGAASPTWPVVLGQTDQLFQACFSAELKASGLMVGHKVDVWIL